MKSITWTLERQSFLWRKLVAVNQTSWFLVNLADLQRKGLDESIRSVSIRSVEAWNEVLTVMPGHRASILLQICSYLIGLFIINCQAQSLFYCYQYFNELGNKCSTSGQFNHIIHALSVYVVFISITFFLPLHHFHLPLLSLKLLSLSFHFPLPL